MAAAIGGRIIIDGDDIRIVEPLDKRLAAIADNYELRSMTPRQMVDFSWELHKEGFLTDEEYAALSFQPELMHNFDRTVGALTGEKAAPDRPRDYTAIWRDRLAFEETHLSHDPVVIERTRKIVRMLEDISEFQRDTTGRNAEPNALPSKALSTLPLSPAFAGP